MATWISRRAPSGPPFEQPSISDVSVAHSVDDLEAQRVVARAIVLAGAQPMAIEVPRTAMAQATEGCSALIWDLAPWNHDAAALLTWLTGLRPDLPILALLPDSDAAIQLAPICRRHRNVSLSVLGWPVQPDRMGNVVSEFVSALTPFVVAHEIDRHAHNGQWLRCILLYALTRIGRGERPSVVDCARAAGKSVRTLERQTRAAELPTPKELIDWATILHLKRAEAATGHASADLARAMGLSANDVYRIRQRIALRMDVELRSIRDASFRQIMNYFIGRCGLSGQAMPTRPIKSKGVA
jgi:hypothetical protein